MKQRSTTPVSKGLATKAIAVAVAVLSIVAVPMTFSQRSYADPYDDQINALQAQIDGYQSQASELSKQGDTLQNQLNILSNQKASIQAQVDASQVKYDKLQADIAQTEKSIVLNREALGETIADIYVSGSISPLEMLASANNISDYVDQQTARDSVSDALSQKINEIKALKKQLEKQKVDVERVLADQKNARDALAAKESEQATLVAQTRNEEASYRNLSAAKQAEKARVQEAQQAAIQAAMRRAGGGASLNISSGDGSMGGYPWAGGCYVDGNAWSHGGVGGNGEDPLGYGCRQCVSYAAWKMYQKTGYAPRYWGNANMWPGSARASGFSVGYTPRSNSLGVISAGAYGHIVYIESYDASTGMARISQFNYYGAGGPGWGNYSEMTVPAGTYDTFIYL
jgi:peptidoglycan hydrolase CwlO-like protein